eukprot:TRINITY_DN93389_c0_g1_i1.p1 TRINITY_DN93389_c0_g1~~TRINITY_DN93389_c0_g1_i1.p1  ORF type:complete len:288 (+),score=32.04 TRINITY_DN93389_c0_g1_i1:73-936(+)
MMSQASSSSNQAAVADDHGAVPVDETAADAHARRLQAHPSDVLVVTVSVVEHKRSPAEYAVALGLAPELAACRRCLEESGHIAKLASGARLFLHPDHVVPTLTMLDTVGVMIGGQRLYGRDLHARHVIFSEEYRTAVFKAVDNLAGGLQVKRKRSGNVYVLVQAQAEVVDLTADNEDVPNERNMSGGSQTSRRCLQPKKSTTSTEIDTSSDEDVGSTMALGAGIVVRPYEIRVWSGYLQVLLPTSDKTASTTQVRGGPNPRKRKLVAEPDSSQSLPSAVSSLSQSLY